MLTLEAELADAQARGVLDETRAGRWLTIERREIFSIYAELRLASYLSIVLITTGLGILLKKNLDRIGPIAIIVTLAVAAAACYAVALRTKLRGGTRSIVGDYIVLLGALLLSADVGYATSRFHFFGPDWQRSLLVIAFLHAIAAYFFDSRLILSASLTSLAAWFGTSASLDALFSSKADVGQHALSAALAIFIWRIAHRALRGRAEFLDVFDHFAANLAFFGAVAGIFSINEVGFSTRLAAATLILLAILVVALWHGVHAGKEAFVFYSVIYGVVGLDGALVQMVDDQALAFFWIFFSTIGAISLLFVIHNRMRARQ